MVAARRSAAFRNPVGVCYDLPKPRLTNLAALTGVLMVETADPAALFRYLGQWNPAMDLEVAPVLDDEESAAAGKKILADLGM